MSVVRWPDPMPAAGRLPEAERARGDGVAKVCDPKAGCPQTLHVSLFFDGTNNNDAPDNPHRDSITQSHTNVARLFDAATDLPDDGIFAFYMPGVGTPFPKIREAEYSTLGKGFAAGFSMRVAWGYTRVLNAIFSAIVGSVLMPDEAAYNACCALTGDKSAVNNLPHRYTALRAAHKEARERGRHHRTVRKVWINAFGFSRGAAEARAFVSRLINVWAPGGKIANEFDYAVNFLGLFDTVASVGPPDSTRTAVPLSVLDGHWAWTSDGQLDIPSAVQRCVHFFSIHEQRMSFPLDTIRKGRVYPGQEDRLVEVAYPGVHSDVGGGYPPGDQGKAAQSDGFKLSQIPLHDMYVEALRAGVPFQLADGNGSHAMAERARVGFSLAPKLVTTFNDWLKSTPKISTVEEAMQFGMGQMLSWRTLRAHIGTADYVTEQPFFQRATEDERSRKQVREETERLNKVDPEIKRLTAQRSEVVAKKGLLGLRAMADPLSAWRPSNEIRRETEASDRELEYYDERIRRAKDANAAKAASIDASKAKPGNTADDLVSNDKTDLLEAAEEIRVLLTWLNPKQAEMWRAKLHVLEALPYVHREPATPLRKPDTKVLRMAGPDIVSRAGPLLPFNAFNDAVIKPRRVLRAFLQQHTSPAAVAALRKLPAVVRLYDDFIHDSRAWFRVPYFREYVPGGYFWARLLFTGADERIENLGLG